MTQDALRALAGNIAKGKTTFEKATEEHGLTDDEAHELRLEVIGVLQAKLDGHRQ